jgi:mono/diheme cytochrome c family protein
MLERGTLQQTGLDMRALRFALIFCLVVAAAAGIFVFAVRPPAIDPTATPAAASFDPALVKRGAALAAVGDCDSCHTAPGGRAFAGGVAIPTPFGTIYSTNITPDAETGIGVWSEAAFQRAMHKGVRRDGAYLYPAFPYDHFALVTDADTKALYAFVMTREPVRAAARANTLSFPFNHRILMAGWNLLFLRSGPSADFATQDAASARGAYLVEGLGHCGACHTPRNALGAEKSGAALAGSDVDGWTAYALDAASPAAVPWTAEALYRYLRDGFEQHHGAARGPMADVVANLGAVPDDDVRAMARYIAAYATRAAPQKQAAQQVDVQARRGKSVAAASADSQADHRNAGDNNEQGAVIYATACAGCHEGPRAMPYGGIDLALSSAISGPNADNLANIVIHGLPAVAGVRSPIMPAFANAIDDGQLVALAKYLRGRFTDRDPWSDIEKSVSNARNAERAVTVSSTQADQR